MTPGARCSTVIILLCSLALPAWGQQYYLYEPKPTDPDAKWQLKEGILVKEVSIRKGDTLYDISHRFSGHGMYYPQILLFNDIKNPNLIYTGDTLRIPISKGESTAVVTTPIPVVRKTQKDNVRKRRKATKHTAVSRSAKISVPPRDSSVSSVELSITELKKLGGGKSKKQSHKKRSVGVDIKKTDIERQGVTKPEQLPAVLHKEKSMPNQAGDSTAEQKLYERAVKAFKQDDYRTALELFNRFLADNSGSPLAADASLYKAECYMKLSSQ